MSAVAELERVCGERDAALSAAAHEKAAREAAELRAAALERRLAEQTAANRDHRKLWFRALAVLLCSQYSWQVKVLEVLRLAVCGAFGGKDVIPMRLMAIAISEPGRPEKSVRTAARWRRHTEALGLWSVGRIEGAESFFRPGPVRPPRPWATKLLPGRSSADYAERRRRAHAREAGLASWRGPQSRYAPEEGTTEPLVPVYGRPEPRRPRQAPQGRRSDLTPARGFLGRPTPDIPGGGGDTKSVRGPLIRRRAQEVPPPSVGEPDRPPAPTRAQPRGSRHPAGRQSPAASGRGADPPGDLGALADLLRAWRPPLTPAGTSPSHDPPRRSTRPAPTHDHQEPS